MIRMLMLGTAVAAVLTTAALAQDAASKPADQMSSEVMSSEMSEASSMDASMMSAEPNSTTTTNTTNTTNATPTRTPVDITAGYTQVDTDRLATKIIGSPVYDGTAKDANNLGKINDLVLDQNGQVAAVVLGVGGFLGIAEKQVAVDFSALQFVVAADNTERFVLQTTKDQLTAAPDFKTVDDQPAANGNAANGNAASAPSEASSQAM
jgi:hypothetical protein